jgi:glycosyltransferase involved in cell wall biosynthesis
VKIAIAVHGRFHAFELARGLHARGALAQVATTYPAFVARRWLPKPIRLHTAPWLEVWRRLHGRFPFVPPPEPGVSLAFARFAARTLTDGADLFVGWSSASLEAIAVARRLGMRVVLERGSTHILHQTEVLAAEYARLGLGHVPTPPVIIERELQEYEEADAIVVPTRFAASTFTDRGVPAGKLIINPLGVDAVRFDSPSNVNDGKPRVLFVGQVGVRKGVAYLLEAFAPMSRRAELHLVGPIESDFEKVLARAPMEGVTVHGPLSEGALMRAYRTADIFCLPSIEEGFGMVLGEAMASGLAIVATEITGARELVVGGREGLLVPPADVPALRAALTAIIDDPEARARMKEAARARVGVGYSWDDYAARAIAAYRRVLDGDKL